MKITPEVVKHTARLSRLKLNKAEQDLFTGELGQILAYMEKLNELNTDGVKPISHVVELHNVWREDKKTASLPRRKAMKNAPEKRNGYFSVPKVID